MTDTAAKNNFWGFFGKLATIIGAIWALTQLYNYYIKKDYRINCVGEHYSYEMPTDIRRTLNDYVNRIALEHSYNKYFKDGSRIDSIKKIDETLQKLIKKHGNNLPEYYYNLSRVKVDYPYFQNYYSNYLYSDYKSCWTFTISNEGDKPIEELILELPYEGSYLISSKNEITKNGTFKNQIELGNLKPTQEFVIRVWVKNSIFELLNYDEEKTRVTHKYGWINIEYAKQAKGIALWYVTNEFSGLLLVVSSLILFFIIFFLGWRFGPVLDANDKKIKLKEFEEMKRLSEEANKDKKPE